MDHKELTSILCLHFPKQMPTHFEISLLPNEISSWLILLLQRLPMIPRLREEHMTARLELGHDGMSAASQLDAKTYSWTTSASKNKSFCFEHSPWLSEVGDSLIHALTHWLKAQSEAPSQMWCRPSGHWGDRIPQKMQTISLASFYQDSSKPSETKTLKKKCKRPFRSQCSTN